MEDIRIVVCGLGRVGMAFIELLAERGADVVRKYDRRIVLAAAVDIGGAAMSADDDGVPIDALLSGIRDGRPVEELAGFGRPGVSCAAAIAEANAGALIETTPTNLVHGEPGKTHIVAALEQGMEVVCANKGPLALFYGELDALACKNNARIHASASTAAALPTLDVGDIALAGARILAIEGLLNGTTNYILSRMTAEGCAYDDALSAAQELGIAETDPSKDVGGHDTAAKLVIIANRLLDGAFGLGDVDVQGIDGIGLDEIELAVAAGKVVKLVGTAEFVDDRMRLSVGPKLLDADHPLAAVGGAEKAIGYLTDTMDRITVMGGKSSPTGAAAALLKDLINAFR